MKLNKLKAKMVEKEKEQKELVKILGLSYVSISQKFNGKIKFKAEEIAKIKDFLNLTNDEVVEIFLS